MKIVGVPSICRSSPSLLVLRDAVGGGRRLHVGVEARDLEPELLRVAVEIGLLEVPLVREERVVHLPELALVHRRDRRARGGVGVRDDPAAGRT